MRLEHKGEYPPHWPILADAVERAAGNRCIRCGHPKGDRIVSRAEFFAGEGDDRRRELMHCDTRCTHPKNGKLRILTVHHLDGRKDNDAWWNLLALCQSCHLYVQGTVLPERPYLFEHSAWFKPYVAGFYAHQHGVDLSRAEIEATLEQWLLLGQPWLAPEPTP